MALFNCFPYSNSHELNLDWILEKIKSLEQPGDLSPEYVQQQMKIFNVKDFGAVGDGITDDTAAIQDAIAAVPETGGVIFFPPGNYIISQTLFIGNGTSTTASSKNSIKLLGSGSMLASTAVYYSVAGTRLIWNGALNGCMVEIDGPINGCEIQNIILDGNNRAGYGLQIICSQWGLFNRITALNCTICAVSLTQWQNQGNPAWATTNNIYNRFSQICAYTPFNNGATCFYIGGDPGNTINDTNMCYFENISCFRAVDGIGMHLGFIDSSTISNVIVWCNGTSTTGHDFLLDGTEITNFPASLVFITISGTMDTTGTIGKITVLGYGMGDGESIPTNPNIAGWTQDHRTFGTWTPYTP